MSDTIQTRDPLAVCRREHVLPRDSALGDRFEAKKRATDALFALPQCEKQGRLASLRQTARDNWSVSWRGRFL